MKVYQYIKDLIPVYHTCMYQARQNIPKTIPIELLRESPFKQLDCKEDYRYETDLTRLSLAAQCDDMMWIDCDTLLDGWFQPTMTDKPWFYNSNQIGKTPKADICVFYSCGHRDFFKRLLNYYDESGGVKNNIGWCQRLLNNELKDQFYFIPDGYFNHLSLSAAVKSTDKNYRAGNENYSIRRDETGTLRFSFLKGVI